MLLLVHHYKNVTEEINVYRFLQNHLFCRIYASLLKDKNGHFQTQ